MDPVKKIIIFLVISLLIIGSILVVRIWIFKGVLVINYGQPPYSVSLIGFAKYDCEVENCSLSVPNKEYKILINKEGYYTYEATIKVPFQDEVVIEPELIIIPKLESRDELADLFTKKFHEHPAVGNNPYAIRDDDTVFFLNSADGRLYMGIGEEKKLLASFSGLEEVEIFPGQEFVYLLTGADLYEVNIKTKRKFRIFSGANLQSIRAEEGTVVLESADELYVRFIGDDEFMKSPIQTAANLVCKFNDRLVLLEYAESEGDYNLKFWQIDEDLNMREVHSSYATAAPEEIICLDVGAAAVKLENGEVYRLEF